MNRTLRTLALSAAFATAVTGTAQAASVVADAPKKLSVREAAKNRANLKRTKRFPAYPKLRVSPQSMERPGGEHRHVEPGTGAPAGSPASERLFGNANAYALKRDRILAEIINFNRVNVPRWGATYATPALYEVQHGAQLPACNLTAPVYNGTYCPSPTPVIGWSMTYTNNVWTSHGDTEWATLIAHEFGHASMNQLGIRGGYFQHTVYREAFADCMAGAFYWNAYKYGLTDNVGRGDGYEFRDFFADLADTQTLYDNHGTFQWRYANGVYGWNNGFDGCAKWGRSVDGV